jgi:hypothetical protein
VQLSMSLWRRMILAALMDEFFLKPYISIRFFEYHSEVTKNIVTVIMPKKGVIVSTYAVEIRAATCSTLDLMTSTRRVG